MHAFRTYIFCQSLYTLQRGLPAIAGLLVMFIVYIRECLCNDVWRVGGAYCAAVWDGLACWNATSAGTTAVIACPSYVADFDSTSMLQSSVLWLQFNHCSLLFVAEMRCWSERLALVIRLTQPSLLRATTNDCHVIRSCHRRLLVRSPSAVGRYAISPGQ